MSIVSYSRSLRIISGWHKASDLNLLLRGSQVERSSFHYSTMSGKVLKKCSESSTFAVLGIRGLGRRYTALIVKLASRFVVDSPDSIEPICGPNVTIPNLSKQLA